MVREGHGNVPPVKLATAAQCGLTSLQSRRQREILARLGQRLGSLLIQELAKRGERAAPR